MRKNSRNRTLFDHLEASFTLTLLAPLYISYETPLILYLQIYPLYFKLY